MASPARHQAGNTAQVTTLGPAAFACLALWFFFFFCHFLGRDPAWGRRWGTPRGDKARPGAAETPREKCVWLRVHNGMSWALWVRSRERDGGSPIS